MPYKNAMGQVYDSGDFEAVLDAGLKVAEWTAFAQREAQSHGRGKLRGRGFASFLEWTGGNAFEERVTCEVQSDGTVEVYATTMPMGRASPPATPSSSSTRSASTSPGARRHRDTDRGSGFGSAGSRSLFTAGSAIDAASKQTVAKGRELAADALEAAAADIEYSEGEYRVAGTTAPSACSNWRPGNRSGASSWIRHKGRRPELAERLPCLRGRDRPRDRHGRGRVLRLGQRCRPRRQSDDRARPARRRRRAGTGQALGEGVAFDETGQTLTASFMDYNMPRADLVQDFVHELGPATVCRNNPLGAKGVANWGR